MDFIFYKSVMRLMDGLVLFSVMLCFLAAGKEANMSKFLSYEDRMVIAQRLQEKPPAFGAIGKELGKDRTKSLRKSKSIPTIKKRSSGYNLQPM